MSETRDERNRKLEIREDMVVHGSRDTFLAIGSEKDNADEVQHESTNGHGNLGQPGVRTFDYSRVLEARVSIAVPVDMHGADDSLDSLEKNKQRSKD